MADQSEGSVILAACTAFAVALGAVAMDSSHAATGPSARAVADAPTPSAATTSNVARGMRGAVAAAAPEASEAGLAVLREGGNAVDALVAASFAVCVVRPQSTGLGGGGFALSYEARTRKELVLDGRERAPAAATPDMFLGANGEPDAKASREGPKAAGVPGLVALLERLHHERGKLVWSRLLEPAIKLAEDGFKVPAGLARAIAENADLLRKNAAASAIFLPGGVPLRAGATLRQPDLARTLRAIQGGAVGFYTGRTAANIATSQRSGGGLITEKDLADYLASGVVERAPVSTTYDGLRVISMPPPSSGGVHLVEMLNVLRPWKLSTLGWHSAAHVHALAETMRRAYADRKEHLADPDQVKDLPVGWLTGEERAEEIRASIQLAGERATPSSEVQPGTAPGGESDHTTHVSVVDAEGNAASATHTINLPFGSGVVVPETGVLLNNEMDDFAAKAGASNAFGLVQGGKNLPAPGKRPLSSMTPTIVLDAQGKVVLVLGCAGGAKIITAVLQVLSNVVDFKMPLEEAVTRERVHHQWLPDELVVEEGLPRETVAALTKRGHLVRILEPGRHSLGEVQAVQVLPSGERVAVTDRRGEGKPAAY